MSDKKKKMKKRMYLARKRFRRTCVTRQLFRRTRDVFRIDSKQNLIVEASRDWDEEMFQAFLKEDGIDMDPEIDGKQNLILEAPRDWDEAIFQTFLKAEGINVDPETHLEQVAVCEAIVSFLLKSGVDPNPVEDSGRTVLHRAVDSNLEELVEVLLKRGFDANVTDKNGHTPVFLAVERKKEGLIRLLIDIGRANAWIEDNFGRTPLSWLLEQEYPSRLRGACSVVGLLLDQANANPNCTDSHGRTALSLASECGDESVICLLLTHNGVDLACRDSDGRTALSFAAEKGITTVLNRLLEGNKACADYADNDGRTPFSRAAENGCVEAMSCLLKVKQVDPNSKDKLGRSPLWWAVANDQLEAVILLLNLTNIDPGSVDYENCTPFLCAFEKGHQRIMKVLLSKDLSVLHHATKVGNTANVEFILDHGFDVNTRDVGGRTALHLSASLNDTSMTRILLERGADVDLLDMHSVRPLELAIQHKHRGAIEVLLEFSAKIMGIRAIDWIAAYRGNTSNGILEICERTNGTTSITMSSCGRGLVLDRSHRRLLCSPNNPSVFHIPAAVDKVPSLLTFNYKMIYGLNYHSAYVRGYFPSHRPGSHFEVSWKSAMIAWSLSPPNKYQDGLCWRSVDHLSSLPCGWIPYGGADFFRLLIQTLADEWIHLCSLADKHLSDRRLEQLRLRGTTVHMIHDLAGDAQKWANLRTSLNEQIQMASQFTNEYCKSYDQDHGFKTMYSAINNMSQAVHQRLDRLDQTVKDLMQLEFAWVSINEAHRSTNISTSIKRLSWITFIFLPAMFASSLFGMNVNILESNPDWRWFLLFAIGSWLLTISVWLVFKHGQIEAFFEKRVSRQRRSTMYNKAV